MVEIKDAKLDLTIKRAYGFLGNQEEIVAGGDKHPYTKKLTKKEMKILYKACKHDDILIRVYAMGALDAAIRQNRATLVRD